MAFLLVLEVAVNAAAALLVADAPLVVVDVVLAVLLL